ncbi:hypothetical protein TWF730_004535 [Orbilia blumenaviensis]|uniref:DUF7918 domain-containing protein n=1 Tax=Orbilia blumenaviensis TaxID=1796055 RepID=A0AAV9TYC7_9PEZI
MPEHKGVSCELHVGDEKVTEYQVETEGSGCNSYVVSQEGKLFSFHLNMNYIALGNAARMDLELWADGQKLDCFTFSETEYLVDDAQIQDDAGNVKVVKLKFAKLETVDEKKDNLETRQGILKKLGSLELKLWRAHHDITQTDSLAYQQPLKNPIYEKSIKGENVTHCTEFADAKIIPAHSSYGYLTRKIDPYETPWVTFVFRHASKPLLEAAGIIPQKKTPLKEKRTKKSVTVPVKVKFPKLENTPPRLEQDENVSVPQIEEQRSAQRGRRMVPLREVARRRKLIPDKEEESQTPSRYKRKRYNHTPGKHWPSDS